MLGVIFVPAFFIVVIFTCLTRPPLGVAGFYCFYILDPKWNWRWAVPQDINFQKYIFGALVIGIILQGFRIPTQAKPCRRGLLLGFAFLAICWISATRSISPTISQQFNDVLWKQLLVVAIGILIVRTRNQITWLVVASLVALTYNSYQINLDYFQTDFTRYAYSKWGSYGLDNNTLSLMTVPFITTALSLAVYEHVGWKRIAYIFCFVLLAHQLMLTMSRGAMLGVLPGVALILWKAPRTRQNRRDFLITAVLVVALAGPSVQREFSSIFASAEGRDSSAESRLYLWKAGARITADYPVLGVGPNAGRNLVPLPEYWDGAPLESRSKAMHNIFFDLSTGMGIPGFLVYMSLFAIPLVHAWRNIGNPSNPSAGLNLVVLSGIISYACASMFSSGLLIESPYILLVAGYALINARYDEDTNLAPRVPVSVA